MRDNAHRRVLAAAALLSGLILVAYWPAVHGGFVWDDDAHIFQNPTMHGLSGLRDIWLTPGATPQYYPLTFAFFWGVHRIWGFNPSSYHLLNIGMHALVALLVWRLFERLRISWAYLGACLFALHPVNVMSVAWVTELKNTLSAALALASCLAYLRFSEVEPSEKERRWRWYAASLVLFGLAMLAKTAVAFLPASLWLIVWWKKDRARWRDALPLVPFVFLVAGMGTLTIVVERVHGGDLGRAYAMSLAERIIVSGRSFWFYLGKLVVPHPLSFLYSRWTIDSHDALQYVPALAMAAAWAALFHARARIGKGPFVAIAHFYLATSCALIFFVVTYFTRFSFVSDHWQYFGTIGIAALVGASLARGFQSGGRGASREAWRAGGVVLVGLCWLLTFRQARIYSNVEALWRDTIDKTPGAWMAHNNLGVALMRRGATQEAIEQYSEALRLKPDLVEAHLNLGNLLTDTGKIDEAIAQYREAARVDPKCADAHFNIGRVLFGQGRNDEAIAEYEEALRIRPGYAEADNSLGITLNRSGRRQEAIEHFVRALQAQPEYGDAHVNLGNVLAAGGRIDAAVEHYRAALAIDPTNAEARYNLGNALLAGGRLDDAIAQYTEALRIKPDHAGAHASLGKTLAAAGRTTEAIEQYEDALRIEPSLAAAANGLGMALAAQNRWPEAVERFRQALRLRSDFAEAHNNLGIALVHANLLPEALDHFRQAVQLRPDFADAQANLARAEEALRGRR